MELHESLHELGGRLGQSLFTDPENFRGALDDYVDETSASVGDINLLVDAVRLGAFRSMTTMLDSGASSDSAIAEAGTRLARDRGSADTSGAMWACAVLGYAIDKVTEAQVRHYASHRGTAGAPPPAPAPQPPPYQSPQPPPYQSPTRPPVQSPQPPPYQSPAVSPPSPVTSPPPGQTPSRPQQPTIWPSSGGAPAASSADRTSVSREQPSSVDRGPVPPATQRPDSSPAPTPHVARASSTPTPTPPARSSGTPSHAASTAKKKPLVPVLGAAAVLLLVLGIGIPAMIWLTGDDSGEDAETLSLGEVDKKYEGLAESITAGAIECKAGSRALGQKDVVECTLEGATLELVTYNSADDLESARDEVVSTQQGSLADVETDTAYYAFDPSVVADSEDPAIVYWDSAKAVQSATYTATGDLEEPAAALSKLAKETNATVEEPTDVEDADLEDFVEKFGLDNCERIFTRYAGEPEESLCELQGYDAYTGQFEKASDLKEIRAWARAGAKEDGCPNRYASRGQPNCSNSTYYTDYDDDDTYCGSCGDEELGRVWGFVDEEDDDNGVVFVERQDCLCYLVVYDGGEGDPDNLQDILSAQVDASSY